MRGFEHNASFIKKKDKTCFCFFISVWKNLPACQSPDLKPIQHFWDEEEHARRYRPTTVLEPLWCPRGWVAAHSCAKPEQSQTFGSNNFPLPLVFLKKTLFLWTGGRRKSHHLTSDIWAPQLQTDTRQFSRAVTGAEGKGRPTEVS